MKWRFKKIKENDEYIEYAYSIGTEECDRIVRYYKKTDEVECIKPSRYDIGSDFSQERSALKLYTIKERGFPDNYQVACG